MGAFAEMSSDVHLLTDLIASAQAADHCEYFAALPSLGLTAHRGWARLLIDRMYTQVQRPEFPQAPEPAWGYLSPADWLASPKSPNPRSWD